MKPNIAIIGAGWAGLAAAMQLSAYAKVTVFEASKQAGGRARGLIAKNQNFEHVDNGQHLLLGAYQQVLRLRQQSGVPEQQDTLRLPSQWHLLDGLDFTTPKLPAPIHVFWGILSAKKWRFTDKKRFLLDAHALQRAVSWLKNQDISVQAWLQQRQVPQKHIAEFWQPLVLATMNTPLEIASLRTLAVVVTEGMLNERQDSDFCLAQVNLQQWWVDPVCRYLRRHGVNLQLQTRVQNLQKDDDGHHWLVNGQCFDRVIVATAPYHVMDVLGEYASSVQTYFEQLTYSAITTVYLRYPEPLTLPHTIQGTAYGMSQWMIHRDKLNDNHRNEVAVVISVSEQHENMTPQKWTDAIHQDLLQWQPDLPQPIASQVITEKRATAHAVVNRTLPSVAALNKQGVYLAGDYCHPHYPATLEGAVQSGQMAAAMCLADWKSI